MLINTVRRFVALSKHIGVKGSDPQIKELMTTLRRIGFSSSQISELSGWQWSSTLVRQYTKNWKGVDEKMDTQRKTIITTLRELVSSNNDINDVEKCLKLEKTVKAKGSSLEELAELNSNLGDLDLRPKEVDKLVELSRELLEQNLNPNYVQYWIRLDQSLIEDGFNKKARMYLFELCNKNGGVYEVLNAVRQYIDLNDIRSSRMRLDEEVERLSTKRDQLDLDVNNSQVMINAAMNAARMGFDSASLAMVSVLSQKLGGPSKVVEAIQKYPSVNEANNDLKSKRNTLNNIEMKINDKNGLLSALHFTLKETKEVYERNITVRQVVRLLIDPRGLKMDRCEVVGLLEQVLDSSIERLDESNDFLKLPDPHWGFVVESIRALADRLRKFNQP